jgi:UDP-N-acetylmuramoylalanine--D-glutamate ligase
VAKDDFSVSGRRVVVVGAARSGIAAAELLVRRGARVMLTDTRPTFDQADRLRDLGVELELGGHRASTLESADLIVSSPGVALEQKVFDGARCARRRDDRRAGAGVALGGGAVIAVTGTKGKSTTTTVIGRMLQADGRDVLVGGNIGVPLSAQVEQSTPRRFTSSKRAASARNDNDVPALDLVVAELGSRSSRSASGHRCLCRGQARVFANQTIDDWAVVNADDRVVMDKASHTHARRVLFSPSGAIEQGFVAEDGWIVKRTSSGPERLVPVSAVELTGRHMLHNVIAATAVASIAGVEPAAMCAALKDFHGLEHVMEPVATVGGVRFVNDSKATNVEAGAEIDRELRRPGRRHRRRPVQGRRSPRAA